MAQVPVGRLRAHEIGPDSAKVFYEARKLVTVFGLREQLNDAISFWPLTHLIVHSRVEHREPEPADLTAVHPIAKQILKAFS